ncbi:helix-turn-helix domain-containing protein [Nonomuraea wenchangensis]|uniref:helix-turn-helix domain-containing protein n=1 Tax=Nonomuraea wenchangensis TaxID=568860 RepID=UPI000B82CC61|nr:helix-turn-helix domain-containing protein [Nonomuraea wenchangensis]
MERALLLFWSRGYGETSVQDLVDALVLERGSLYGAFGDKRQLVAALQDGPVLPALREVLANPARAQEYASDAGVPQGCMIGNTTAELVPYDAEAREIVARSHVLIDALRAESA